MLGDTASQSSGSVAVGHGGKVHEEPATKSTATPSSCASGGLVGGVNGVDLATSLGSALDGMAAAASERASSPRSQEELSDEAAEESEQEELEEDIEEAAEEAQPVIEEEVEEEAEEAFVSGGGGIEETAVAEDEEAAAKECSAVREDEAACEPGDAEEDEDGWQEQSDTREAGLEGSRGGYDAMEFSTQMDDDDDDDFDAAAAEKEEEEEEERKAEVGAASSVEEAVVGGPARGSPRAAASSDAQQLGATGQRRARAGRALAPRVDDDELVSDEGKALAQALREAQAALEAARQYVTSPWLEGTRGSAASSSAAAAAATASPSSPARPEVEVEGTLRTECLKLDEDEAFEGEAELRRSSSKAPVELAELDATEEQATSSEAAPPPDRPGDAELEAVPSAPSRLSRGHGSRSATPTRHSAGIPGAGEDALLRKRIGELHARFGENAAKERVQRAKSLDRSERKALREEERARASKEEEDAARAREMRQRAARRSSSERRAAREQKLLEEEKRAAEAVQREADAKVGRQCASSAARRAASEKSSREALARDVLADLHTLQAERRKLGDAKGKELQQRCHEKNWGHAKSVVEQKRKLPPRGPSPAPPPAGDQEDRSVRDGTSIPTLPRVLPSPRGRGGKSRSLSTKRAATSAAGASSQGVHLPPISG